MKHPIKEFQQTGLRLHKSLGNQIVFLFIAYGPVFKGKCTKGAEFVILCNVNGELPSATLNVFQVLRKEVIYRHSTI